MPPDAPGGLHLHVGRGSRSPRGEVTAHWRAPLVPVSAFDLVESVVDTPRHVAEDCLPRETALVLWESAVRTHRIPLGELNRVRWHSATAAELCAIATGNPTGHRDDLRAPAAPLGARDPSAGSARRARRRHARRAPRGAPRRVRLPLLCRQSAPATSRTTALMALGYRVPRFSYTEVVYNWPAVEAAIARALAQQLHLQLVTSACATPAPRSPTGFG